MAVLQYLDFDLQIERTGKNRYRVRVLSSPAGQASGEFKLPFSELELENFLLRIGRPRRGVRRLESPEMETAKEFGGKLFRSLFNDELLSALRSSLDDADKQERGLRLRLRLNDAPELVNLPWEYLYNPALNRFLTLSATTPVVRYLELPERIAPLKVEPPLQALVMIANPSDYTRLDVEHEWQNLKAAVSGLEQAGVIRLDRLQKATPQELQNQLRKAKYHIFHFIGHGGFHEQTQDGILLFEDEAGRGRPLSGQFLGTLLRDQRSLRLVVLNACEGARSGRSDPFAGVAQSLVQQGIPAVIAMQFEITDEAAIAFGREFYTAVAEGYPLDAGVAEARKAIYALGNDIEWGTPVLYLRAPDGLVFDVGALPEAVPAPQRIPEGIRPTPQPAPIDLEPVYLDGLSAYWEKDWERASQLLGQVIKIDPAYQDAAFKLADAQQQLTLERLYRRSVEALQARDWPGAEASLKELIALNPKFGDALKLLEQVQREQQLARLYTQAKQLHAASRWQAVLNIFDQIDQLQSGYPDAAGLRSEAADHLAQIAQQEKLAALYQQALQALQASQWQVALELLRQVEELEPGYKGAARLKERAQAEIEQVKAEQLRQEQLKRLEIEQVKTEQLRQEQLKRLEAEYERAQVLAKRGRWQDVLDEIEAILAAEPDFVDRDGLAIAAREALAKEQSRAEEPRPVPKKHQAKEPPPRVGTQADNLDVKLIRVLTGHTKQVNQVVFSPDDSLLASASGGVFMGNGPLRLWRVSDGRQLLTLDGHTDSAQSVAFSSDGRLLASGSQDKTIRLWRVADGKALRTLEGHSNFVKSVAFSPDGSLLASGSCDNTIRLWRVADGKALRTLQGHSNWIDSIAFSPDGSLLASGSEDKTIRLWRVADGKALRTLEGHTNSVDSIAFSPDASLLASGSMDHTIRLWRLSDGAALRTLKGHSYTVYTVAFSPDGSLLASGSSDNTIRMWRVSGVAALRTLEGHTGSVCSVAFSPNGRLLASGSADQTIRLWQL
jgi:WD40 repeat protein